MSTLKIFNVVAVAVSIALMQSCKLEVKLPAPPTITTSGTIYGYAGGTVTIKGRFEVNAAYLYEVKIGNTKIPQNSISVPDSSTLTFTVPAEIGSGPLSISLAGDTSSDNHLMFIYQLKVTKVDAIGTGSFSSPQGMAVDQDGNIILADFYHNQIKKITTGRLITVIAGALNGSSGTLDGRYGTDARFNHPVDVTQGKDNAIYVADSYNNCIRKIDVNNRNFVITVGGQIGHAPNPNVNNDGPIPESLFDNTTGVAVDTSNNINNVFAVEPTENRLRFINFADSMVSTLPVSLKYPLRLIYSKQRAAGYPILIADHNNNRILEIDSNNPSQPRNTHIKDPQSLAFHPQDLEVDQFGDNIVLDKENRKLFIIYPNDSVIELNITAFGFSFSSPSGIAIDQKSSIIYVSDENTNHALDKVVAITYN